MEGSVCPLRMDIMNIITKYKTSDECKDYKGGDNAMNIYIIKDNFNAAYKKPTSQSSVVKDSSLATDGSRVDSPTENLQPGRAHRKTHGGELT
ncbi:hypothetical protein OS493_033036 [Desmophyllum pertusum]|uniref:Uncharacterized protein n=1 Tax=Desmophyllum pertusum TaxID=174260 RepID=A0A9X0D110_9CNID|nr:hypothetical protein OS493_033036 [Desmophyllum pertusum]